MSNKMLVTVDLTVDEIAELRNFSKNMGFDRAMDLLGKIRNSIRQPTEMYVIARHDHEGHQELDCSGLQVYPDRCVAQEDLDRFLMKTGQEVVPLEVTHEPTLYGLGDQRETWPTRRTHRHYLSREAWLAKYAGLPGEPQETSIARARVYLEAKNMDMVPCVDCDDTVCHGWTLVRKESK